MNRIDAVHPGTPRRDLPPFRPGDTVRVHVNITEGDKQRIQVFEGVVIRKRGHGPSASFTVRKISSGVGVERIFQNESPNVTKLEIKARGHVRRSRLYYLRDLRGKKARIVENTNVRARKLNEGERQAAQAEKARLEAEKVAAAQALAAEKAAQEAAAAAEAAKAAEAPAAE